jgi:hypothetical protein
MQAVSLLNRAIVTLKEALSDPTIQLFSRRTTLLVVKPTEGLHALKLTRVH